MGQRDGARDELIAGVLAAQQQIMRSMQGATKEAWLDLDLTLSQIKSLLVVSNGPLPIHALAEQVGLQRPAASILVEHLVQLGVVTRTEDTTDRRRTLVDLTPTGVALIARLRQGNEAHFRALIERLSEGDLSALAQGIAALAAAARAWKESMAPIPVGDGDTEK